MKIGQVFDRLKEQGKKAVIPYITAGDPNLAATAEFVSALDRAGVDIIELGVPYSDPLADGPVIQRATGRALAAGTTMTKIFDLVQSFQGKIRTPIVLLVYFNPVYKYGMEAFAAKCAEVGVAGLIIPDLPLEERAEFRQILRAGDYPVDLIPLVAPTSRERIGKVVAGAGGFVYAISSRGVTGVRSRFSKDLSSFIGQIRAATKLPVCLGFGIGNAAMAAGIKDLVDGVIFGSVLVEMIEKAGTTAEAAAQLADFAANLRAALD
ncbi:MAG: tryptophan synthase subunit alpha [Candidatus Wallacebacter cryptica]|jgi:tryptophan synthase alpha chain|nr:tryptophan synthase subunit alpha [Bacillota bacterium]